MTPDVGGLARVAVDSGEVLGTISVGHPSLRYLSSDGNEAMKMFVPQRPNAQLQPCNCSCDISHVDIVATKLIAEGAAIIVNEGSTAAVEGFLLQFDGSCRREEALEVQGIVSFAFGQAI